MLTLFPFRIRRFSRDEKIDRSLRHSVKDGLAYSVMHGSGESYLSAYALYFKASNAQIGVLASLPPLLGSFAQLFSAWLGHRGYTRKSLMMFGVSLQAFMLLPMMLLPLLLPDHALPILISCAIVYFIGHHLASPQWWSLMGDLVPERRRGRFFAMRTRLCTLTAFVAFVIAGVTLHFFDAMHWTMWGFVTLFVVASIARFNSVYHLSVMHDPSGHVAALESPFQRRLLQRIRGSAAARFSLFFAAMQFSVSIASPFFVVYMLKELQLSYLEYTVIMATMILSQFLSLPRWGRVCDVFGNRVVLRVCGSLIPIMPLLWTVSTELWFLIAIQIIGGFGWAGFTLATGNYIYDLVPANKRATYLAMHNVLAGCAVFAGALFGSFLASHLPNLIQVGAWQFGWFSVLYGVFVTSSLLRLIMATTFLPRIKELRAVRPISWRALLTGVLQLRSRRQLASSLSRMRKPPEQRSADPG